MRAASCVELLTPAVLADDVAGLEVLASQDVVDVLEASPPEGEPDADAKQLVGARVDERVLRAGPDYRRVDGSPAELLELRGDPSPSGPTSASG